MNGITFLFQHKIVNKPATFNYIILTPMKSSGFFLGRPKELSGPFFKLALEVAAREAEASWKMCKSVGLQMSGSSVGTAMPLLEAARESAPSVPAQCTLQPKLSSS